MNIEKYNQFKTWYDNEKRASESAVYFKGSEILQDYQSRLSFIKNEMERCLKELTPIFVYVYWSESGEFKDNELVHFGEFEERAFKVASKHPLGGGYYKTKIKVLFSDGSEYVARLDLAIEDTHGFKQHVLRFLNRYESAENDSGEDDYLKSNYSGCYEFLSKIQWPV